MSHDDTHTIVMVSLLLLSFVFHIIFQTRNQYEMPNFITRYQRTCIWYIPKLNFLVLFSRIKIIEGRKLNRLFLYIVYWHLTNYLPIFQLKTPPYKRTFKRTDVLKALCWIVCSISDMFLLWFNCTSILFRFGVLDCCQEDLGMHNTDVLRYSDIGLK